MNGLEEHLFSDAALKSQLNQIGWFDALVAAQTVVTALRGLGIKCQSLCAASPQPARHHDGALMVSHVDVLASYPLQNRREFRALAETVCKRHGVAAGALTSEMRMPGTPLAGHAFRLVLVVPMTEYALDVCEHCGSAEGVQVEESRTAYDAQELNRNLCLCPACADEHHRYWDERWAEYRAGCM